MRPNGQSKAIDAQSPIFGPSSRLDFELELGVWIGPGNELGAPIPINKAAGHVAGFCLLNDWSARDLQAWEYQPLGPFLAKNFMSTISPWVVTIEAMAPFFLPQPPRPESDPKPMPYLWDDEDQAAGALSVTMEVFLSTVQMRNAAIEPFRISRAHATDMYWTVAQIVAHHTSNGCNLSPGDLLGTGTVSSSDRAGLGSLLEMTCGGAEPLMIPDGSRTFLEDGDEIIMTARAEAEGFAAIGFGPCRGIVSSAL